MHFPGDDAHVHTEDGGLDFLRMFHVRTVVECMQRNVNDFASGNTAIDNSVNSLSPSCLPPLEKSHGAKNSECVKPTKVNTEEDRTRPP